VAAQVHGRAIAEVPMMGRWTISGVDLPDDVRRHVYAEDAVRIVPGSPAELVDSCAVERAAVVRVEHVELGRVDDERNRLAELHVDLRVDPGDER
jgi:hypothetical protein